MAPGAVGTEFAHEALYMKSWQRTEETPPGVPNDAVVDEATLVKSGDGETCMHLVVRTAEDFDDRIDTMAPVCEIDRSHRDVIVTGEVTATRDYAHVVETNRFHASGIAPNGRAFEVAVAGNPEQRTFRVVERRANVCCAGTGKNVQLVLRSTRMVASHTRLR